MENALKIFEHPDFGTVRTIIEDDGEPWFYAQDVAIALEYSATGAMNKIIDNEDKIIRLFQDGTTNKKQSLINESGLYQAIFGSSLKKAQQFKRWVTCEVLPSVRKHGFYGTKAFVDKALSDPDGMITILQNYKFEKEKRELAERQRDEAVRTKAWIGSRREATAMNRASVYSKECERLREEIGDSRKWKQVTAIPWLGDYFDLRDRKQAKKLYNILGRKLTAISRSMGFEVKKVASTEYETVNAYKVDALNVLRDRIEEEPGMLLEYRKQVFTIETTEAAQCG